MASDDDDDTIEEADPLSFEDPIAQRVSAFVQLALCVDRLTNDKTRDLVHDMMKKVTASVRVKSTADVVSIAGGKA
jgi:hypothetical protein